MRLSQKNDFSQKFLVVKLLNVQEGKIYTLLRQVKQSDYKRSQIARFNSNRVNVWIIDSFKDKFSKVTLLFGIATRSKCRNFCKSVLTLEMKII